MVSTEWCKTFYLDHVSTPLIRVLKKYKVNPNTVTIGSHCITLTAGIYFFSRGSWVGNVLGLAVMIVIGMLDYADGDLAKQTRGISQLGVWIDSVFDVVIQNAVMAAIAIGCYKQGLPLHIILFFFVGNAATNLVSFHYNATFGFDSHVGNELFRKYMKQKPTYINRFFKNLIDPTSSGLGLVCYTVRYWIVLGAIFNIMPRCFLIITILGNIRWIIMYILFALHLIEYKKLWVSQALAILDEEREERYAL